MYLRILIQAILIYRCVYMVISLQHYKISIPFISKFRVDFQTQLMETTKIIHTVSNYIPTIYGQNLRHQNLT